MTFIYGNWKVFHSRSLSIVWMGICISGWDIGLIHPITTSFHIKRVPLSKSLTLNYSLIFVILIFQYFGGPSGLRTRVTDVRGRCPRPLDDGTMLNESIVNNQSSIINEQIVILSEFCR